MPLAWLQWGTALLHWAKDANPVAEKAKGE
jgi:hypothetical protein